MNPRPRRNANGLYRNAAGLACLAACGHSSPAVASYPQPDFAPPQIVPFAPPVNQLEYLPEDPPAPDCRWVDGQWTWAAQRWNWQPGSWIVPPEGCRYSPPTARWASTQGAPTLYYRPGRWYAVDAPKVCANPAPCPTKPLPGASTAPAVPSAPASKKP
jgi:hypothetical protein